MLVHFLRKLSSNLTEKGKDLPGLEIRDAFSDKSKWVGAFGEYLGTFDKASGELVYSCSVRSV